MGASFGGRKDQEWFEEEFLVPMGCAGPDACCAEAIGVKYKVIVVGLDGAGKTSLCLRLVDRSDEVPIRTGMEEVIYNNKMARERMCNWVLPAPGDDDVTLEVCDVGGRIDYRHLWCYRFKDVCALIFVVDACDRNRLHEAQNALYEHVLPQISSAQVPLMILLHEKQGQEPMTDEELLQGLGIKDPPGRTPKLPCAQDGDAEEVDSAAAAMVAATIACVYAGQSRLSDRELSRMRMMFHEMQKMLPAEDMFSVVRVPAQDRHHQDVVMDEAGQSPRGAALLNATGALVQRIVQNVETLRAADVYDEEFEGELPPEAAG